MDSPADFNGPFDEQFEKFIKLAKDKFEEKQYMMTIHEFIAETGFDIDPLFVDEHWALLNSVGSNSFVELTPDLLQRLNFATQQNLIKKLMNMFPSKYSNDYARYLGDGRHVIIKLTEVQKKVSGRGGNREVIKKIYVTKSCYKELLMETQTSAARQVRKYYIALEDLFQQYLLYQRAYTVVCSRVDLMISHEQNVSLAKKNDELVQRNADLSVEIKRLIETIDATKICNKMDADFFVSRDITKTNVISGLTSLMHAEASWKVLPVTDVKEKQELVVLRDILEPEKLEIVRGQRRHIEKMKKRKANDKEEVMRISDYMNPSNLFSRFRSKAKNADDNRFEIRYNKIVLKNEATSIDVQREFMDLNDEKYAVAGKTAKMVEEIMKPKGFKVQRSIEHFFSA
jgi:hypothetical protein